MRQFKQYLFFLFLLSILAWLILPSAYGVIYPKALGPVLDDQVRTHYQVDITRKKPYIVLLGDSSLEAGVDHRIFSKMIGKKVYKIGFEGSGSAVWYLIIKNNLFTSPYKPKTLILFYRDTLLTIPDFRASGAYFAFVDELADQSDELLIQRAYQNQMGWLEKQAAQYIPLYGERSTLRSRLEFQFRYGAPLVLHGYDVKDTDDAIATVFNTLNLDQAALNIALTTSEDYLFEGKNLDFDQNIQQSFLPEIIRLCHEVDIQLIFVRMKTLYYASSEDEPLEMQSYHESLKNYLNENDIPLIDFNDDPRISPDWFVDAIHFGNEGMTEFTQMLAEEIIKYLK